MSEEKALAKKGENGAALTTYGEAYGFDVTRVVAQTAAIQQVMSQVMQKDEHYGVIPGTGTKPSLLQPGADKLCMLFRLRPEYEITEERTDSFVMVRAKCRLYHIPTGQLWGEGVGSCNSKETKYVNQTSAKLCPKCAKPAIIKGREEYGGGWLCYGKKDGCGAKFKDGDKSIEAQAMQVLGDKVMDLHNTITKMACKRAKVGAILTCTAASDIFTQDVEDLVEALPGAFYTPPARPETVARPLDQAPSVKSAPHSVAPAASSTGREPGSDDDAEDALDEMDNPDDTVPVFVDGDQVGVEPRLTPAQLKKLHVLRGTLGDRIKVQVDGQGYSGDEAWRRILLRDFGKDTSRDLSTREASKMIDKLQERVDRLHAHLRRADESIDAGLPATMGGVK